MYFVTRAMFKFFCCCSFFFLSSWRISCWACFHLCWEMGYVNLWLIGIHVFFFYNNIRIRSLPTTFFKNLETYIFDQSDTYNGFTKGGNQRRKLSRWPENSVRGDTQWISKIALHHGLIFPHIMRMNGMVWHGRHVRSTDSRSCAQCFAPLCCRQAYRRGVSDIRLGDPKVETFFSLLNRTLVPKWWSVIFDQPLVNSLDSYRLRTKYEVHR